MPATVAKWLREVQRKVMATGRASGAVAALREATEKAGDECRQDAAAAAWHADPVLRFLCATFGACLAGVSVSEDGFIVITAELTGDGPVETRIVVEPDGTCACRIRLRRDASCLHGGGPAGVRAGAGESLGGSRGERARVTPAAADALHSTWKRSTHGFRWSRASRRPTRPPWKRTAGSTRRFRRTRILGGAAAEAADLRP